MKSCAAALLLGAGMACFAQTATVNGVVTDSSQRLQFGHSGVRLPAIPPRSTSSVTLSGALRSTALGDGTGKRRASYVNLPPNR